MLFIGHGCSGLKQSNNTFTPHSYWMTMCTAKYSIKIYIACIQEMTSQACNYTMVSHRLNTSSYHNSDCSFYLIGGAIMLVVYEQVSSYLEAKGL